VINILCPDDELLPVLGSKYSAGMDLKTSVDFCLLPGQEISFGTGVSVELPRHTVGLVVPRSSMGKHLGLYVVLKNTMGVIDSDYRGEIQVKLRNMGNENLVMYKGDRVCQMIVVPHLSPEFTVVKELGQTDRGAGGFGSTGCDIKLS
jgi:dUTP pyrophosphatase